MDSIRLTEQARQKKVDDAAEKASYLSFQELGSDVKDVLAVASKVSSETYRAVANSDVVKKISSSVKTTNAPTKKLTTRKKKK